MDAVIEFAEWNAGEVDGHKDWQSSYRRLSPKEAERCDANARKLAADRLKDLRGLPATCFDVPQLSVGGRQIPPELQPLARQVIRCATLGDYLASLRTAVPPEYCMPMAKLDEEELFALKRQTFLALLPQLGFTDQEISKLNEVIACAHTSHAGRRFSNAVQSIYVDSLPPTQQDLVRTLASEIDSLRPLDHLVTELVYCMPRFHKSDDPDSPCIIDLPPDDAPPHQWSIEARLARGLDVPFDQLVRFPELLSEYGA